MMRRLRGFLRSVGPVVLVIAVGLAASLALAQSQPEGVPQPALRNTMPAWRGYAVMFLLVAVVMLVSLMPSKRGHQD